ncbi:hypothetical protein [Flocculibacter collagenilyticus]|uniref:hypothetical protein n=1 Tax=Flocculibacter collagenilyticus TaxID=2744479 RepID=UPI0018F2B92A|nr:hypothetical protein [Flocculibacter collagenilyticus]
MIKLNFNTCITSVLLFFICLTPAIYAHDKAADLYDESAGVLFSDTIDGAMESAIESAISDGFNHYKQGDLTNAEARLSYATNLIREKKALFIKSLFPEPLTHWQCGEVETDVTSGLLMGGGISASRAYQRGDSQLVEIEVLADSPMLPTFLTMFNNPAWVAMSGARLIDVQGHKAILKNEDGEIEVTVVVGQSLQVTLRGSKVREQDVIAYANAFNLAI